MCESTCCIEGSTKCSLLPEAYGSRSQCPGLAFAPDPVPRAFQDTSIGCFCLLTSRWPLPCCPPHWRTMALQKWLWAYKVLWRVSTIVSYSPKRADSIHVWKSKYQDLRTGKAFGEHHTHEQVLVKQVSNENYKVCRYIVLQTLSGKLVPSRLNCFPEE